MKLNNYAPYILGILRIFIGIVFFRHGLEKFITHFIINPEIPWESGLAFVPFEWSATSIAGIFELITGPLIILGLFTRPAAFIASGVMAAAYFMAKLPNPFDLITFVKQVLIAQPFEYHLIFYTFFFFYLVFAGAGKFALDNLICKSCNKS